jgi:hypothetical protein
MDMDAKEWGRIVSKAWADEQFKQRLLADPVAVLKENGVPVPAGVTVNVIENTATVYNLTLTVKPSAAELTDDELESIAGGRVAASSICDYRR